MLKNFNYLYKNTTGKIPTHINKEELFEGEKIMYRLEEIKLEDE